MPRDNPEDGRIEPIASSADAVVKPNLLFIHSTQLVLVNTLLYVYGTGYLF
jgi:hypothetical protein